MVTRDAELPAEAPGANTDSLGRDPIRAHEWLFAAAFALVLLLQLMTSAARLSQTSDEANHLQAGYRYWQCRDFGYNVEHPPLAKLVAALPLRFVSFRDPFPDACGTSPGSDFQMGRQFLYADAASRLLALGRFAVSWFAVATLLLAWFWTRSMFGRTAATIVAILLAFEPNLLAHGALITTDAAVSFGMLASVAALWFYAQRPTWTRTVLVGLALGVALAAKFSSIIVFPILLVLLIVEVATGSRRERSGTGFVRAGLLTIIALCVAVVFVWTTYGFRYTARPGGAEVRLPRSDWEPGAPQLLQGLMNHHLVPEAYGVGLSHVLLQAKTGQPMFLFGRLYDSGRWFYFPAVLLLKLSLPMLLLIALAIVSRWWRGRGHDVIYLALPAAVFLVFAMYSKFDIGVRHVLPVIIWLVILGGAAAAAWIESRSWAKWVVGAALVLHVAGSLHAFPNYMSYANVAWGGPSRAYRQVTDSNTDWGQALKQVGQAATKAGPPCWVLSPYQIPLAYYGVLCRDLRIEPSPRIHGRVYVSSTAWSGVLARELGYDPGEIFRGQTPSATVAGSAFLVYEGDFDLHTNLSLIYASTAQALLSQGRAREAVEYAQQAAQLRPDAGTPHSIACAAEWAAGAPDVAKHECAEATRLLNRNAAFNRRALDSLQEFISRNGLQ